MNLRKNKSLDSGMVDIRKMQFIPVDCWETKKGRFLWYYALDSVFKDIREKKSNMVSSEICSDISGWYAGKSVFITGASGFMGKVLLEKLLFSCPQIKHIFILIRPKRGRTVNQRIEDLFRLPLFQRLQAENPIAIKKVVPINGDLVTDSLGICREDLQMLLQEVNVVFHCAATLKLEGTLHDAIDMNVAGTIKLLDLCHRMKNLNGFVHLSTAFCNCDVEEMKEKVYDWRDNPHEVIRTVKWMREDALVKATPDIIFPHPNTYTYSKRLAELIVQEQYPKLPVCITRPSIVCPAAIEPVAGWVDNLNGPIGLLVGAGKGVIRSMHCYPDFYAHVIPVDMAINALIAIAHKTAITAAADKPALIPVYNMTQDSVKRVTFREILDKGKQVVYDNPFEMCVWYPGGDMRTSKFIHYIYVLFCHFLPAYIIDFLMLIFRQKRFMVRIQWRIQQGLELLQFFTTRQWKFDSTNFMTMIRDMPKADRKHFDINFDTLDIDTYLKLCVLGARQYCMKENLSSLPRCRLKQKFLYVLDKLTTFLFFYFLLKLLGLVFPPIQNCLDFTSNYFKSVGDIKSAYT